MGKNWLDHYPKGVRPEATYPRIPLYKFLQDSAARRPEHPAIVHYDGEAERELSRMTYGELDSVSGRMAAGLTSLGIGKGDRVAYFLQNRPELVVGFYGILKAGAVAVPCNPMYQAHELAHQLSDSGAKAVICEPELHPRVKEVLAETAVRNIIVTGSKKIPGTHAFSALLAQSTAFTTQPPVDVDRDLALLPYTGGTTGVPKAAMLTHRNLVTNTLQFRDWFSYRDDETFITVLPLFHIGGIAGAMNVPIAAGGTMVLFRRFHPRGVLRAIQDYRATRFLGVPTMYIAIMDHPEAGDFDLSSLRPSRTSAAPLPAAVKEAFDRLVGHETLIEGYGLTETSPLTHANPIHRARAGSIGVPLPDTDARIVDADDGTTELPAGEVGELLVKGPQVMQGYWGRPEETDNVLSDGWLYTGDLAQMDEEGYFYIVDRKKDVINAAGFKVWPREVEETLYRHPLISSAAVTGVADSYRGETVMAVVVLKDGHGFGSDDAAQADITAFCRRNLAAYKVPRIMEFRDQLPVSAAGKVLRRLIRDEPGG